MTSIGDWIDQIAANKTSGASELALQALEAVRWAIRSSQSSDTASFTMEIEDVLNRLANSRPSMPTIANSLGRARKNMQMVADGGKPVAVLKRLFEESIQTAMAEIGSIKNCTILAAASFLRDGAVVVTCSYGSTIIRVFQEGLKLGKHFSIRILRSRFQGNAYGEKTRRLLEPLGLDCQMVEDNQLAIALAGASLVLLGSDQIFPDGSVTNGYPSLALAQAAAGHRPPVPVYVVGDSLKYSQKSKEESEESGFDWIPAQLVTGIITEKGLWQVGGGHLKTNRPNKREENDYE